MPSQTSLSSGTVKENRLSRVEPVGTRDLLSLQRQHRRPLDRFTVKHELHAAWLLALRPQVLHYEQPPDGHVKADLFQHLTPTSGSR